MIERNGRLMQQFSAQSAVEQVRAGAVRPEWQIYPVKSVQAWFTALATPLFGVGFIAFAVGNVIYSLAKGEVWAPQLAFAIFGEDNLLAILAVETLIFLIAGIAFLAMTPNALAPVRRKNEHFLLIASEGFAQSEGKKTVGAAYDEVKGMVLEQNAIAGVALRDGSSFQIWLNKYGNAKTLFAHIRDRVPSGVLQGR